MIDKNKFLSKFNFNNSYTRKIVNDLIYFWHDEEFIKKNSNYILKGYEVDLTKAILFVQYLLDNEASGFHTKANYQTLFEILKVTISKNEIINLFGILCPSYKKGIGAVGFAQKPGNTTHRAFHNLLQTNHNLTKLGISSQMVMFYSDISLENCDRFNTNDWGDLENNIKLDYLIAKKYSIKYERLTHFSETLFNEVGYSGKIVDTEKLPISQKALERAMWRDRQFYPRMFGWSIKDAELRSICHAHSYYWQGKIIRENLKNPIMVYSAYDYEKGALYNGREDNLPPYVIYPIKDEANPKHATLKELIINDYLA